MKLKEEITELFIDEMYYDVFDGGYLKPENLLDDQDDIDRINQAIEVLEEYFEFLEDNAEEI